MIKDKATAVTFLEQIAQEFDNMDMLIHRKVANDLIEYVKSPSFTNRDYVTTLREILKHDQFTELQIDDILRRIDKHLTKKEDT